MEFNYISDIALKLIDKIDNQWKLFFASNLGVSIWVYSDTNTLDLFFTIIASFAFVAYSLVCCFSAIRAYKFLEYAMIELNLSLNENAIKSEKLRKALKVLSYNSRIYIVIVAYFIAIPLVLFLFWHDIFN